MYTKPTDIYLPVQYLKYSACTHISIYASIINTIRCFVRMYVSISYQLL